MKFSDLGLNATLLERCESLNFTEPTPIQEAAIPIIMEGSDLIGCAETGTGKTAAFLLPTIQKISENPKAGVRVLVVAPTRELVLQIEEAYKEFDPRKNRCVSVIGGANMNKQIKALQRGVDTIIATPGRLNDHIERGNVNLATVDVLILDEADRMLDMGFLPQIRQILSHIPKNRQTLLFSATMADSVKTLAYAVMDKPEVVEVSNENKTAEMIEELVYPVAVASKTALLIDLLETKDFERVIVFSSTKRGADRLAHILSARGLRADTIHADRSQSQREAALNEFRDGKTRILVATDIASRGIDVDLVSHVVNYDVPTPAEDYVHRVGRTGRAGNIGTAITLVSPIDEIAMKDIERLTNQKIERVIHPEFGKKPHSTKPENKTRRRRVTTSFA